jgi:ribose transport system substrate-binding protein
MAQSRTVFSLSLVAAIALVAVVVGVVGGRATVSGSATGGGGGGSGGAASGQKVDVIIRATDSAYWQTLLAGADAAATDFGITVGKFGPTSETDIAGQVQLVENSVSRGVNAIVIAPSSSEALNASIDAARKAGIKVITADTKVTATIEGHIGTNNKLAGTQAGQRMCELLTAAGKTTGKVLVEAPVAGIEANQDRDAGFRAGLAEKCPNVDSKLQNYNSNDIGTAAAQVNDAISANPDLVGVFADNNSSGVGAATAIKDNNAADRIPVVAFDSDPAENAALAAGTIDALVVQNPYFLGYQGVIEAAMSTQGRVPPAILDPGVTIADTGNMNDPEVKSLLEPPTSKVNG